MLDVVFKYLSAIQIIDKNMNTSNSILVDGLGTTGKSIFVSYLFKKFKRDIILIYESAELADKVYEELPYFGISTEDIFYYPNSLSYNYSETKPDYVAIGERLSSLMALTDFKPKIIILPAIALTQKTMPKEELIKSIFTLKNGEAMEMDTIINKLVDLGYNPSDVCDHHGVFCKRGGLIDVFPSNEINPVRITLDWDEVSEIKHFDTETQRSTENIGIVNIFPNREVLISSVDDEAINRIKVNLKEKLEFLKDTPEKINRIKTHTERIIEQLKEKIFFDELEYYLPYIYPNYSTISDYFPSDSIVIFNEPHHIDSNFEIFNEKMLAKLNSLEKNGVMVQKDFIPFDKKENILQNITKNFFLISFSEIEKNVKWLTFDSKIEIPTKAISSYVGKLDTLMEDVANLSKRNTIIFATAQENRMLQILRDYDIEAEIVGNSILLDDFQTDSKVLVTYAPIEGGVQFPLSKLYIITDKDIFGTRRGQKVRKLSKDSIAVNSYLDLVEGDYVVHVNNGIAIYKGTSPQLVLGAWREFIILEFRDGANIYVSTDNIQLIQKYIGGDGNAPTLSKLGGSDWNKAKTKAKKKIEEIAKELMELYAWRESLPGFAYGEDTEWQSELEKSFPYEETYSQMQAIKDVKRDLQSNRPMDRLICGDVGYGKTEVAIRSAFKVACEGRQVAILAPTTVLAQQHYLSFKERMAPFPQKIEILSRFRSPKEIKESIANIKSGKADIIIGTHRLLSKDIEFNKLGLLIVDEEQRFGVKHKERLKQLKKNVDVLTLSATPIPRTLHMSLTGIRSMSLINDAPEGRVPIKTIIKEFDEDLIRNAIRAELERDGQVFFIHNRVENINSIADKIEELVPEATVDIAHGQMSEKELEEVMMDFYSKKLNVLVATTIIENGLDVSNANTIIINNANKLGLAQLYQLRGRVGRSSKQAFAYLLYDNEYELTEISEKRLRALKEFSDLGSGFRIAMRDLEIRGAGNLLGNSQSGSVESIGFDLYCQLLSHAISELKGEKSEEIDLPAVDMPVDSFIPAIYIPIEAQRILFYKKLAAITDRETLNSIQEEIIDRFGDPPQAVWNMLNIIEMRIRAYEIGIKSIGKTIDSLVIVFKNNIRIMPELIPVINNLYQDTTIAHDRLFYNSTNSLCITKTNEILDRLPKIFKMAEEAVLSKFKR